jgi:hypothetical protein
VTMPASVAFNVLHVATIAPAWGRYAVAAVPPIAAMLALAALMRQVFSLAIEAHLADTPEPALGPVPGTVLSDVLAAAKASMQATVAAGNPLSLNQLAGRSTWALATPTTATGRLTAGIFTRSAQRAHALSAGCCHPDADGGRGAKWPARPGPPWSRPGISGGTAPGRSCTCRAPACRVSIRLPRPRPSCLSPLSPDRAAAGTSARCSPAPGS